MGDNANFQWANSLTLPGWKLRRRTTPPSTGKKFTIGKPLNRHPNPNVQPLFIDPSLPLAIIGLKRTGPRPAKPSCLSRPTARRACRALRLEPVVHELVRFGLALGVDDDSEHLTCPEWDIVALRALYRPDVAGGLEGRYILELDGFPFCIERVGDDVNIYNADVDDPRIRISLSKSTARKLASAEISYDDAVRREKIRISGSKREARKLLRSFSIVP